MKQVGKTTRAFRYDLNQIPYDYTVEVRNRFKGLDLIDRVPDELWTEVRDIVQETGIKTIPMEKKCNIHITTYEIGALQVAPAARQEMHVPSLGQEDIPGGGNGNPLQYSCLEIPWTEECGGLQSMVSK